jgi:hypothetical protein
MLSQWRNRNNESVGPVKGWELEGENPQMV